MALAPSLHTLTAVVRASAPSTFTLPDGSTQTRPAGLLALGFRTGQLSRARLEIRALALAYMQADALAERANAAVGLAKRAWSDALSPFHEKMASMQRDITDAGRGSTVAQELLSLLACGVPPTCVQTFLLRELKEPDLARSLKAVNAAADAVVSLVVTQLQPALEMLVQRLGHLQAAAAATQRPARPSTAPQPPPLALPPSPAVAHTAQSRLPQGLSRWPHHFAALGLQPPRVATALDAACAYRAAAEVLLLSAKRTRRSLRSLLCWLIRITRKLREEAPPASEDMPPHDSAEMYTLLADAQAHGGLPFDAVLDTCADEPGPALAASEDKFAELAELPPIARLPCLERDLASALSDCFRPIARHVSAGFQLHACLPLDGLGDVTADKSSESRVRVDLCHVGAAEPAERQGKGGEPRESAPPLLLALTVRSAEVREGTAVQLVLLRARWQLQAPRSPCEIARGTAREMAPALCPRSVRLPHTAGGRAAHVGGMRTRRRDRRRAHLRAALPRRARGARAHRRRRRVDARTAPARRSQVRAHAEHAAVRRAARPRGRPRAIRRAAVPPARARAIARVRRA